MSKVVKMDRVTLGIYFYFILFYSFGTSTALRLAPAARGQLGGLAGQWSSLFGQNQQRPDVQVNMRTYGPSSVLQERTTIGSQRINQTIGRADGDDDATTDDDLLQTTTRLYWNTTNERCDYQRIRCLRAFATGALCARTLYYQYYSFPNYCTMDFHNCMNRYDDVWMVAYMGICTEIDISRDLYVDMGYDQMANNSFLMQMYTEDSGDITNVG